MNIWQHRSVVHQKVITIPHAQILTLPTVPITLVPAPGLGKVIIASAIFGNGEHFVINFNTPAGVAYTNIDSINGRIRIRMGTTGPFTNYSVMTTILDTTHSSLWVGCFAVQASGGTNADWYDEFENIPIKLSITNGALGNLTGGHIDNKWTVTIGYHIYDMNSKEFTV